MKKLIVSMICAAVLVAPALAGGDCCSSKDKAAAPKPAACCSSKEAKADKPASCAKSGAQAQNAEKKACCKETKTVTKACQEHAKDGWFMTKPTNDCKACQTASL